jgi:hypothetical protein
MYTNRQYEDFQKSLELLHVETLNFATRFISDAKLRQEYLTKSKQLSNDLTHQVHSCKITPQDGAKIANSTRNLIMEQIRLKSSEIGRAYAEAIKKTGKTLPKLESRYALEKFNKAFEALSQTERNQVWLEIVASSGRPKAEVTMMVRRMGYAGRALLVMTIAVSVYNVATADDKPTAVAHEATTLGGGILGGAAGGAAAGAVAGVLCGPGAPLCEPVTVTVGVFVGGVLGALGADYSFKFFSH